MKPAIIVVAYNRTESLRRLLNSLASANYETFTNVTLVISVDYSGSSAIADIAKDFNWIYGNKEVILHQNNLGLKKHILACGDLSQQYKSVIILEDDLVVSPFFYSYTVQCLNFYKSENYIAGISLYSPAYNENARMKYIPIHDGFDNYFIQIPSSWGQAWTHQQWQNFREWYSLHKNNIQSKTNLPSYILAWSNYSSWKKYFAIYLVEYEKYFVFPRISLTTNMVEVGTHHQYKINIFQVPLLVGSKFFNFSKLSQSISVYDAYYELSPNCLKQLVPQLKQWDFECDFYGTKKLSNITEPYLFSSKNLVSVKKESYGLELLPQELNIKFSTKGTLLALAETKSFRERHWSSKVEQYLSLNGYFGIRRYISIIFWDLYRRLMMFLNIIKN